MTHSTSTHPKKTMRDPQIQSRLYRLRLKESIARYGDPKSFLLDVAEILNELGAAKLAETDPLIEQRAERDIRYSTAIAEMLDDMDSEN